MMPGMIGPPSSHALSLRPYLLASFALLIPVAVARMLIMDVIGGILLGITALMGWYASKDNMDIPTLLCLFFVLFMNSILDAFIIIVRITQADEEHAFFKREGPISRNVVHVLLLIGPLVEMVAAVLCWRIYREFLAGLGPQDSFDGIANQEAAYGAVPPRAGQMSTGSRPSLMGGPIGRQSTFEAFSGRGRRLED